VLDSDFKTHSFLPYASDLSDVSRHLQALTWNAGLLFLDPVKLEWKPLAAKAMPIVENSGRKLTFQLRTDLFWSDGSPILATDYVFAFNNAVKETRYPHRADLQHILNIDGTQDKKTLVITFDNDYANAFEIIKLLEPLPEKVWQTYTSPNPALDAFSNPDRNPEITHPSVVSGPYLPDATAQNYQLRTSFFLGRPNFDRISLVVAGSQADLVTGLKAGNLGWTISDLPAGTVSDLQSFSNLATYRWTPQDAGQRYIGYNLDNSFLDSPAVRQALNRTLDIRSLIATIEKGQAVEQTTFLPANNPYAIKRVTAGSFSLNQAQEVLKNNGYYPRDADGLLADLAGKAVPALELIYPDNLPEAASIAVYLQQQYNQLGLKVNLNKLDQATYLKARASGKYDLEVGLLEIPGALDPDDFKAQFVTQGSLNFGGYSNSTVDSLFAQGLRLDDPTQNTQRHQLYEQLQQILADDSPVFFLYTLQSSTVMARSIDPGGAGLVNLPAWQLAWDAFPAIFNWYQREAA
jgi:peptide/nickel transport system substrate-binding protein